MATIQKRPGPRYRVQVRLKGCYHSATFPSLAQARQWATQTEHTLYEQHHFARPERARYRLRDLLTRYEREVLPRKSPGTCHLTHKSAMEAKICVKKAKRRR